MFLRHVETLLFYWYLTYFQILPLPRPKYDIQAAQPLDEKTIFFKNVHQSFKNMFQMTEFVVLIPKTYITGGLSAL